MGFSCISLVLTFPRVLEPAGRFSINPKGISPGVGVVIMVGHQTVCDYRSTINLTITLNQLQTIFIIACVERDGRFTSAAITDMVEVALGKMGATIWHLIAQSIVPQALSLGDGHELD
jgi:hypothetical protein